MSETDTKGLSRFIDKIKKAVSADWNSVGTKVSLEVAKKGAEYLEEEYANTTPPEYKEPKVSVIMGQEGWDIMAFSPDIAFIEFGTGRVGQQSGYEGNLQAVSGLVPVTGDWQYYYGSDYKVNYPTKGEGWLYKTNTAITGNAEIIAYDSKDGKAIAFTRGTPSGGQLFKTANYLLSSKEVKEVAKKAFKAEITRGVNNE